MDQIVFNWLIGGLGALCGIIMKVMWDAIRQIERDLPEVYVRKDDFKDAVKDLKDSMREGFADVKVSFNHVDNTLGIIFKKLDKKEDKA